MVCYTAVAHCTFSLLFSPEWVRAVCLHCYRRPNEESCLVPRPKTGRPLQNHVLPVSAVGGQGCLSGVDCIIAKMHPLQRIPSHSEQGCPVMPTSQGRQRSLLQNFPLASLWPHLSESCYTGKARCDPKPQPGGDTVFTRSQVNP